MPSMGGLSSVPHNLGEQMRYPTCDPRSTIPRPWGEGSPKLRTNQGSGLLPSLVCSASLGSEGPGG